MYEASLGLSVCSLPCLHPLAAPAFRNQPLIITGDKELELEGRFQAERTAHSVLEKVLEPRPLLGLENNQ